MKVIPETRRTYYSKYLRVLSRNDNIDIDNEIKSRHKLKLLDNIKFIDIKGNIITAKDVTVNSIEEILNKKSLRKCQDKWNKAYSEHRLCPKLELISIGWISII